MKSQVILMEKTFILSGDELRTPCTLTIPDGLPVQRVVLGVHGIGGSSFDEIQTGIAEEMTMFSSAAVRFDFPCHGENPCTQMSVRACRETLLSVARWIRQNFPHVEDLCIFASGFGAYITLLSLEELLEMPGTVKLVVQTPSVMMHSTMLAMRGITREMLQQQGRTTFHVPRPFDVTYEFYQELLDNQVLVAQPIPMLILHGEADDYIRMEDIQNFRRLNEQSKLVIIPGTSHRFLEEGAWDMVLDLTRDWFSFEQVLLCDWD